MTLVVIIIALALIFDYINGFHDAANSIATVVSTKVLTPFQAVLWAALFNCAAYFIFQDHAVANTISKTIHKEFITLPVILSGLIAAIFWNLLTWWYGIPSSSSHTLIGGLAGAAIAHAISMKGIGVSWASIIEADTIIKTVLFIFLAPLIGMAISIFITIVTIMRNVWLRIGIIAIATFFTFILFDQFESSKIEEGTQKFLKIDKYKADVKAAEAKLTLSPADSSNIKTLAEAKDKLTKATANYEKIKPLLGDYDNTGAAFIAKKANEEGALKEIEASKLKDEVRNANGFLILEAKAVESKADNEAYKKAKELTEKYKEPLKLYCNKTISLDSTMILLNTIYSIADPNKSKIETKISSFNIEKSFTKDIEKSDNRVIAWGIVFTSLLFCLIYIYVEKIRTPTAFRVANMFKKLQLFSSAAFSIGHGGNDAQKVMGVIGVALISSGQIQNFSDLPNWVPISCYLAIGLGTMSGGWKIVKTMGTKITKVTPLEGVAAETAGAFTLFFTGQMGIPVSTTHTITGSIMGVGATKRLSAVRWGVTINLLWAWVLTIPVSAILAAIVYWIVSLF
ncbi:inorganic phosphate transporter [Ferruginibacter lapsinanis]|uniref:inorganic phosphate transporter n=1 Tax=Ferruginibacter lapsinanis TaxID=563172 RepID=UPI001E4F83C7|nr:inorganic phosphate transporter [Ferruginibacter lapsinanis]UEG50467.1 inorganic phosphate transporter [Ferruginibacter lapsinanis]